MGLTLICHYKPVKKTEWKYTDTPGKKKFQVQQSLKKVMLTVFWYMKGPIDIDFLEKGATVKSISYCQLLLPYFIYSPSYHRTSMAQGLFLKWVWTQGRSPHASNKIHSPNGVFYTLSIEWLSYIFWIMYKIHRTILYYTHNQIN